MMDTYRKTTVYGARPCAEVAHCNSKWDYGVEEWVLIRALTVLGVSTATDKQTHISQEDKPLNRPYNQTPTTTEKHLR